MTGKTMAEHARAYRTRKAEKMARMEAALREIASLEVSFRNNGNYNDLIAARAVKVAIDALG